jgi:VWFA-related protein
MASLVAGAAAQQTPPVFRGRTDRVRLDVTVTDRNRPVKGLKAEDFQLKDNGVEIPELELATTSGDISVAIALDIGPGVREWGWEEMQLACDAVIETLQPRDTAWLVTFSNDIGLKAGPVKTKLALRRALANVSAGASSALWDALFGSIAVVTGQPGRAMVIVISDGRESGSYLDHRRALEVFRRSEVVVAAIRPPHQPDGFLHLEDVVKLTGGEILQGKKGDPGRQIVSDLVEQFRLGYVLTYSAAGVPPPKDGWHEIEVSLKKKRGEVHARKGYYEPGK